MEGDKVHSDACEAYKRYQNEARDVIMFVFYLLYRHDNRFLRNKMKCSTLIYEIMQVMITNALVSLFLKILFCHNC